jgi:sugar diacid utilization regulator
MSRVDRRQPGSARPGPEDAGGIASDVLAQVGADAAADAGGLDVELLGDFLPSLSRAVAAGQPLRGQELQRCRASGQRAARAGVALPALLDLYLSAGWRLWRRLPVAHAASEHPDAVVTGAEVMLRAVDDAVAALAQGYQLARRGLVREQESARREFIDDLLAGGADVAGLLERAAGFGLDLSGPHAVAVVRADKPFTDGGVVMGVIERAVQRDTDLSTGPPALVASKDTQLVVVFAAATDTAINELTAALSGVLGPAENPAVDLRRRADLGAWQTGVGRARPGPAGVLSSYQEARTALELAAKLALPAPVLHAADLLVYQVLLRDRAAISDLVVTVLAPLEQARGGAGPLLDTLAAYFAAGGNAARAARAMHLSVRALTYRLDRVRRLTGHDPTSDLSRFTLHAAILGAKLLDWPAAALD